MKASIVAAFFALCMGLGTGSIAFGDNPEVLTGTLDEQLKGYQFRACSNWIYMHGENYGGYVCTTLPERVTVPEGYSAGQVIKGLRDRITSLESRIKTLEEKLDQHPGLR